MWCKLSDSASQQGIDEKLEEMKKEGKRQLSEEMSQAVPGHHGGTTKTKHIIKLSTSKLQGEPQKFLVHWEAVTQWYQTQWYQWWWQ